MTMENREDYIKYRFHRAEESLKEALILADNGMWNRGNQQIVLFMFLCGNCSFTETRH